MAPTNAEKEKKSRWRSMLGGGRDAKEEDDAGHLRPGPSPKDSAYGSERTTPDLPFTRPQSSEPSETSVKQDPSTGNIMTTTVTTTTTTTTVTTGKGEHIKTESTPTVEADASATIRDSGGPTSAPAAPTTPRPGHEQDNQTNQQPDPQHHSRSYPSKRGDNITNPTELDAPVPGAASAEDGPRLPAKSNRRISRDMGMQHPRPISEVTEPPVSPIGSSSQHNFSYPARTPLHPGQLPDQEQQPYPNQQGYPGQQNYREQRPYQGQPPHHSQQGYPNQQQQPPNQEPRYYQDQLSSHPSQNTPIATSQQGTRPGTFQNLKTAAIGIHGAGETLRGTLNSSIDRHVGHAPPERLAAHEQVVSAGAAEIEAARFHEGARERERLNGNGNGNGKGRLGGLLRKPVG